LANQFLSIVIMLRHRVATDENVNVVTFLKGELPLKTGE